MRCRGGPFWHQAVQLSFSFCMNSFLNKTTWFAAVVLLLVPLIVAFDSGGTLAWTKSIASCFVLLSGLGAFSAIVLAAKNGDRQVNLGAAFGIMVLLLWIGFMRLQTMEASDSLVKLASPGTYQAYQGWLAPTALQVPDASSVEMQPHVRSAFPLSIGIDSTGHAVAIASLAALAFWVASWVFEGTERAQLVLIAVPFAVSIQGLYIIFSVLMYGDQAILSDSMRPKAGSFLDHNNAALFLNLGLACSIGAFIWLHSAAAKKINPKSKLGEGEFLVAFVDPKRLLVLGCALICVTAILVSRSGVGVIGMLVGAIFSVRWFRSQGSGLALLAVVLVVAGLVAVAIETGLDAPEETSVLRDFVISLPVGDASTHWPDGLRAAKAYLPFGSGAGTYASAYLPYQITGGAGLRPHADNVFLELFVEQGIPGLLFAFGLFWAVFRGSRRIFASRDATDRGIRVAGAFAAGAVISTQFMDHGIVLLSNLLLFAVLIGAMVARSKVARTHRKPKQAPPPTRSTLGITVACLCGVIAMVCSVQAAVRLRRDAFSEYWIVASQHALAEQPNRKVRLQVLRQRISEISEKHPSFEIHQMESQLLQQQALLARDDAIQVKPIDSLPFGRLQRYLRDKRRGGGEGIVKSPESTRLYLDARDAALAAAARKPLSISSRVQLVYLSLLDPTVSDTSRLVVQLSRLLSKNPQKLRVLGDLLERTNEALLAVDVYRQMASISEESIEEAIEFAERNEAVSLVELIPKQHECQKIAAEFLVANSDVRIRLDRRADEFLLQSLSEIDVEGRPTKRERAACEVLRASVCFELEMAERGTEHLVSAVSLTPADAEKRLILCMKYYEMGQREKALLEARKGRKLFPMDTRFQTQIELMATESVEEAEQA